CGLVTTLATASVLFAFAYSEVEETSLEQMRQIASNNALGIEKTMSQGMQTVYDLKSTLTAMKQGGNADRAAADKLLETLLKDNPMALGIWTGWDPDAFDG